MSEGGSLPGTPVPTETAKPVPPTETPRRPLLRALRWLALLAILALLGRYLAVHREDLRLLLEVSAGEVGLLVGLQLGYLVLQAWRYQLVLRAASGRRLPFLGWLRLFCLGRFLNTFLPQTGNLYRALRLKRSFEVSYTGYAGGYLAFAWLDLCLTLGLAWLLLAASGYDARLGAVRVDQAVLAILLGLVALPFAAHRALGRLAPREGLLATVHRHSESLLATGVRGLRDPVYAIATLLLGLVVFALAAAAVAVGFSSLGHPMGAAEASVYYLTLRLSMYVNITPGNLGVSELLFGALGSVLDQRAMEGVLAAALLRLTGLAALVLASLTLAWLPAARRLPAAGGAQGAPGGRSGTPRAGGESPGPSDRTR